MENKQKIELFSGIALIFLGLVLIILIFTILTKGPVCMQSPFVYGSKILTEKNNADLNCECVFDNEPEFLLKFNKEKQWVERKVPLANAAGKNMDIDYSWLDKIDFTGGENED
jgi:hypothetical protein